MKEKIQEFIEQKYKGSYRFLKPKMFLEYFGKQCYEAVLNSTIFLAPDTSFSQKLYCFVNNITTEPLCKVCNSPVKYNTNTRYQKYCCNSCRLKDIQNIQTTKKETNLQKYGTTNVLISNYGKQKSKNTCLQKYGVDNYTKSKEYKDRLKNGDIIRVYNREQNIFKSRIKYYNNLIKKYPSLIPKFTLEEYKGSSSYKILYKWECRTCKTQFEHWLNNNYPVLCPTCKPKGTYYENRLKQFLTKHNITYQYRARKIIDNYELDFYLPDLNTAIEIHGLYWHSEKNITDKNYHLRKLNLCLEKNINLIQIFEDEFYEKEKIVFSRLKHLNHLQKNKIFARKCIVKEVNITIKRTFLNKYHIQGDTATAINYGLFYKNRLVAVMGFGKLRRATGSKHQQNTYELIRYCTIGTFSIIGGGGKLFKHFLKTHVPESVISYADRRWSQGNFYKQLDFKLEKNTEPNYWYTKNYTSREHRFNFQKHLLQKKYKDYSPELTEKEIMLKNGYTRIWDCGHLKYVFCNKYVHDKRRINNILE
jgi:very-short-patch-repair endonuclease